MNGKSKRYPKIRTDIMKTISGFLMHSCGKHLLKLTPLCFPLEGMHTLPYQWWMNDHWVEIGEEAVQPDICSAYEALPLCSESVDVIISSYLTNYIYSPQLSIREYFRVLKPNGYFCLLGLPIGLYEDEGSQESLLATLQRLGSAYTLSQYIKQEAGIILYRKYFFNALSDVGIKRSKFYHDYQNIMKRLMMGEQHGYLIMAQKRLKQVVMVGRSKPIIKLSSVLSI